jgi:cytochrome c peroxidase
MCGSCHGGPLLNTATEFNPRGQPAGTRFTSAGISEFNLGLNPLQIFVVTQPDGTKTTVSSPDPGLMLITGNPADANFFKMVSLRNLKNTAPYFHDNSAMTIEQVMLHYSVLFAYLGTPLSPQDVLDITAYLKRL